MKNYSTTLDTVESEDSVAGALLWSVNCMIKDIKEQISSEKAHIKEMRKIDKQWSGDSCDYLEMAKDQLREATLVKQQLEAILENREMRMFAEKHKE